jgi:tetratricopeptide (TPR) repeat protein
VLKRNPDAAIAYNNLGTYYLEMGRFQDAERTLKAGAERIPDDGDLWGNLGVARLELNRPADAEASLDRALALDPGNPWWRTTRANALARSDRAEAAIEALNALLTDRPDWIEAYNALAMIQADRGRMAEAIATLERALRVAPGHPILIENLRALRRTPPP